MSRLLAVIDTDTKTMYVERSGRIGHYDIAMYAAALDNPKYWREAEIKEMPKDCKIPDLLIEI